MELIRNEWISNNGKYKVVARKFEDGSIDHGCFIKNKQGKYRVARNKNLPQYVKNKMNEMLKEVN